MHRRDRESNIEFTLMMNDQVWNIPFGFHFEPSDEELINEFLVARVRGLPLPWNGIVERDLYGDNAAPWDVFRDMDDIPPPYCNTKTEGTTTKKTVYVFTTVAKAAPNSKKRISRGAGCGTWSGQTGPKPITDSTGGVIGHTKMLSFKHKGVGNGYGHWIMHEYSLTAGWNCDVVLCRVTRCMKDSDLPRSSSPAAVEETHERVSKNQKRDLVDEDVNSNDEVEGCTTLAAEEKTTNHEEEEEDFAGKLEEMLVSTEESAAAPAPPSTPNGGSTLSCPMDDDIYHVFSLLDSTPPPKNLAELFEN